MIAPSQFARFAADPVAFRNSLTVDVSGSARKFGDIQDDWQRADFASLDEALQRCNGRSNTPCRSRAYFERPRGHSKTTDLAITVVWALAFATRPIRGYCYAADRDQARLLKDAVQNILRLNPWLSEILTVEQHRIVNTGARHPGAGGTLNIEASDVGSSFGILPDLIIVDELTHWEGDGSLWHSLISSAAKRSNCLLVVISNAGFIDSWQWQVREAARTDDNWIFSRLDGPRASWMTDDRLAEQRRMLPPVAYLRLWENQWSTGGGDALSPEDIAAAFREGLAPMTGKEPHWSFVAGVDLGLTRDCSAVVVLGVGKFGSPFAGRIRLASHRLWKPVGGQKINLSEVERHIVAMDNQYDLVRCAFDPWQAEHLAQRLELMGQHRRRQQRQVYGSKPWMQEVAPTGSNLRDIASLTIESFNDRRVQCYPCQPLHNDLLKLRVEEKSYGYRLTSPRDAEGHGDTFSAFSLALFVGHEQAGVKPVVAGAVPSLVMTASTINSLDGSPFQRAADRLHRRAMGYEEEMSHLSRGSTDDGFELFQKVVRSFGR